jgi:phosphoenolpyruvate-protein phosphotransferase (PTS system enzyme I)
MAETRYAGRSASPGFAAGRIVPLTALAVRRRTRDDPEREAGSLRAAMAAAASELAALAAKAAPDAADILAFQLALLHDDALTEPAFAAIAENVPADEAWRAALDAEIAGYLGADDEHFRARSADLRDLRDRVLAHLAGTEATPDIAPGSIVAASDLPPSRFLAIDWRRGGAILLSEGSGTSHVAMLARSRGIPMIVGLGVDPALLAGEGLVDATAGAVVIEPSAATWHAFEESRRREAVANEAASGLLDKPGRTADGVAVAVHLNIAEPGELALLSPSLCDGIGLVRTEFLFHGGALPGEEVQLATYRHIAEWAQGKSVTIRTLDAGGDKPIEGVTIDGESNPFLGVRGIRLSLARSEIFRVQLRALARAALHGDVRIMLPMVSVPAELAAARALLDEEVAALAAAGIPARRPPLGIMVEVPAAALAIDLFDADFFSIGSNDLTQYVMAAGRDIAAVADLADPRNPAVLRLIRAVAAHGRAVGREVSLCGDAAGDPTMVPHLLGTGLRSFSVAPAALGRTKAAIAALDLGKSA